MEILLVSLGRHTLLISDHTIMMHFSYISSAIFIWIFTTSNVHDYINGYDLIMYFSGVFREGIL